MNKFYNDPEDELDFPDFPTDNPSPDTTLIDVDL